MLDPFLSHAHHRKHMDRVGPKDGTHGVVADDLALVFLILKIVGFDVFPYLLHGLRPRQLRVVSASAVSCGAGQPYSCLSR